MNNNDLELSAGPMVWSVFLHCRNIPSLTVYCTKKQISGLKVACHAAYQNGNKSGSIVILSIAKTDQNEIILLMVTTLLLNDPSILEI